MAKINGIDLDDIGYLRDQIETSFGSFSVFTTETGLPYRKTLDLFNKLEFTKKDYNNINNAYKRHIRKRKSEEDIPFRISAEEREKIRLCILSNFDSYTKFSLKHKEFNVVYLSNVIKGNLKLRSRKYFSFVKLLTKKYKLKVEFN